MPTVTLRVRTRGGDVVDLPLRVGPSLMDGLRGADMGVEGTCGGACSCGTCHIYASDELNAAAPKPDEDEAAMLEGLADVVEVRPSSRLACQIPVSDRLDGVSLEIAPQV